jgi:MoxR-like ATPase
MGAVESGDGAVESTTVVLTSNRSRDLHDALRRRCRYHWIDYPDPPRAAAIVRRTVLGATTALIEHTAQFVGDTRAAGCRRDHRLDGGAGRAQRHRADGPRCLASLAALAKTPDGRDLIAAAFAEYAKGMSR